MTDRIGWGILGTGNIARQFCTGVLGCRRGRLIAVGSRADASAREFAQSFQIPAAGDYPSVLANPAVDVVYIALPNSMHHEWTLQALAAGKHVLCEKPLASNEAEAREMFAAAHAARRLLVEAFMYRAHPLTHAVLRAVRDGAIGPVRLIRTSFCFRTRNTEGNIRFNADLAGGALMDIGCYCINFSRLIANAEPLSVHATGLLHPTGVDEMAVGALRFPDNILASFTCGMTLHADNTAYICGEEGYIEIPIPWKPPARDALYTIAHSTPPRMDRTGSAPVAPPRQTIPVHADFDLYALEADDIAAALLDGAPFTVSPEDTLANMRILDTLRRQLGVPC